MYCNNCGNANSSTSGYCVFCGAPLSISNPPPSPPDIGSAPSYSAYPAVNPVYTEFLRMGRSPALLTAIIAYTVYTVFSLLASVLNVVMFNFTFTVFDLVSFTGDAISILFLIAMWKIFVAVRRPTDGIVKTSGLSMLRVCSVIRVVFLCTVFFGIVIALMYEGSFIENDRGFLAVSSGDPFLGMIVAFSALFIIAVIVLSPFIVCIILYYVLLIRSIRTVTYTINTGYASAKVSSFVIVMSFIAAGLYVMTGVTYVWDLIPAAASTVSLVSFGIFLHSYKKTMRTLVYAGFGDPSENPVYLYYPPYRMY